MQNRAAGLVSLVSLVPFVAACHAAAASSVGAHPSASVAAEDAGAPVAAESCPFDYAGYAPRAASVSFARDVAPLLAARCAGCHGDANAPAGDLWLGPAASELPPDAATLADVRDGLLATTNDDSGMREVEPFAPARSWLLRKLDGDVACDGAIGCRGDCAEPMPLGMDRLSRAERDTVRDWVLQGAAAN